MKNQTCLINFWARLIKRNQKVIEDAPENLREEILLAIETLPILEGLSEEEEKLKELEAKE